MSNSGNKGVFSNNIGSSVGGFTKRKSGDAGSDAGSGSTAERRRVSRLIFFFVSALLFHFPVNLPRSLPQESRPQYRPRLPMQL